MIDRDVVPGDVVRQDGHADEYRIEEIDNCGMAFIRNIGTGVGVKTTTARIRETCALVPYDPTGDELWAKVDAIKSKGGSVHFGADPDDDDCQDCRITAPPLMKMGCATQRLIYATGPTARAAFEAAIKKMEEGR